MNSVSHKLIVLQSANGCKRFIQQAGVSAMKNRRIIVNRRIGAVIGEL
jgi:hypothetical protein